MATQGPLYPGTVTTASVSTESANDWLNPSNIGADDGSEAQITAATYDSPDISFRLIAANFGFSVSGTVNGITVEIDRRSIIANSGADFRVQLQDATGALVGANKAVTGSNWPTTSTVATYGGAADTWTASPTAAMVNSTSFGVVLSVSAKIANADIGVDFIRVTVTYTPPTNTTVTPGVATLTTTPLAPTVSFTANQTATPGAASLTVTTFAPTATASDHKTATPATAALTTTSFAPTATASDHKVATPGAASLATATFVPTVIASAGTVATPDAAGLSITALVPTVSATDHQAVTPGVAALALTALMPTVAATAHVTATPPTALLSLTELGPDVAATAHLVVTPSPASLTLLTFAPGATGGQGLTLAPTPASLELTTFAALVAATQHVTVTPEVAALALAAFAPDLTVAGPQVATPDTASLVLVSYAPAINPSAGTGIRADIRPVGVLGGLVGSTPEEGGTISETPDFLSSITPVRIVRGSIRRTLDNP